MADMSGEIISLAKLGIPPKQIEKQLEGAVSRYTIYRVLWLARKNGQEIPLFPTNSPDPINHHPRMVVAVDAKTWTALVHAASARGMTGPALASELIETICRDGIIDAVMDDED